MINESSMNLFPNDWVVNGQVGVADLSTNLNTSWSGTIKWPVGVSLKGTKTYLSFVAKYPSNGVTLDMGDGSSESSEKVLKVVVKENNTKGTEVIRATREITRGEFDNGKVVNVPFEFVSEDETVNVEVENLKTGSSGSLYGTLKFGFDAI